MTGQPGERLWRFHGGMALAHHKRMSVHLPVPQAQPAEELILALAQGAGSAATPAVEPGQSVLKGECIASAEVFDAVPLHAPTSGVVTAVEECPVTHPSNLPAPCIVLRPDGRDEWTQCSPVADYQTADADILVDHIAEAGIVGLGGAAFPSHLKLRRPLDRGSRPPVSLLILNGAECEPYISCDEVLMRERPDAVISGAAIMLRATGAERCLLAVEDNRLESYQALTGALQNASDPLARGYVELAVVPTIYPEGGERQLIQVLTGREVPSDGLPLDIGLVCQNVATAAAVHDAVVDGVPLIERYVTVTGHGVRQPTNFRAALGTPLHRLVAQAGGYTDDAARLIVGGPLMGYALASDAPGVAKGTNCLLTLTRDDVRRRQPEMPCIRCMECVDVCPAQLLPQQLHWHIRANDWSGVEDHSLFDCIECGLCAYVCPSHIPLVDYFRYAKDELERQAAERDRAERARRRYEQRLERLERERREHEERRRRKKEALRREAADNNAEAKKAAIDEAVKRARAKKRPPGSRDKD